MVVADKKEIIINGINISNIQLYLETGHRAAISTKEFEKIIDTLVVKTQECEELEKILKIKDTEYNQLATNANKLQDNYWSYKQALDEIEEVFKKDQDGDYDFIKWRILNIINEVKE